MSIEIKRSDKYVDYNISAANNRGYITIDTSDWINKPWMFYELPSLKFEIYTETNGELVKYQNFSREIRTYNPVYSPLGVLNVTIDIRNVPEEFILRITPIFDNDAVAARNMLIENGIENGDIWGSDQDVPTQLFNLDLEFIECEGEYVPPTPPVPPTHEETITGVPPITFDGSTGEPLVSWTILGNGQQTGTPTPQSIIMPTFCGVRTAQLIDYTQSEQGGIDTSGNLVAGDSLYRSTVYVPVNITITTWAHYTGYLLRLYFYKSDKTFISRIEVPAQTDYQIQFPQETAYIKWTCYKSGGIDISIVSRMEIMLNTGDTALPYEPFGHKIPISCGGETTPVYLGQTQTVRRIGRFVLTGDEDWGTDTNVGIRRFYAFFTVLNDVTVREGWCSHFKYQRLNEYYNCYKASDSTRMYFFTDHVNTINDFKQFLRNEYAAGTPVTVWYVLAEPTTGIVNEPLCKIGDYADELSSADAVVTIQTANGSNVLTVDTDLQPSEMTITYIKEGQ